MRILVGFILVVIPISLFGQSKLADINEVRIGANYYRDSTVQRGFTTRLDYVLNKWLNNQYMTAFVDFDIGIPFEQIQPGVNEP